MNVVDSSAWLAYFAGEPNAAYFAPTIENTEILIVPSVCIYEVFRVVFRESGYDSAAKAVTLMKRSVVVELDLELATEAAEFGLKENLALADSVIYATAQIYGATLWTQDAHFKGKPGVNYKEKTRRRFE